VGSATRSYRALHGALGGVAMAPDHRRAFGEVRGRKAHAEAQHRAVFAVQRQQVFVEACAGCIQVLCAFSGIRYGSRGRHRLAAAGAQAARHQLGRQRAGVGHVDVRVGAVGHQRVGLAQHAVRDVGVQVQAGDDGQVGADQRAQPAEQLAFAVVGMLGHRGAVQVEVDAVQAAARRRAPPHVVARWRRRCARRRPGHVRRRDGAGPGRRHQRPALRLGAASMKPATGMLMPLRRPASRARA
jgi:hypothetical protein